MGDVEYQYRWISFRVLPDRYGHPCKKVKTPGFSAIGYQVIRQWEFPDGLRVEAPMSSVKRASRFLAHGHNKSIAHHVLMRMRRSPRRVFTPEDFADLGTPEGGVGQALSRLVAYGAIGRVDRGRYRSRL